MIESNILTAFLLTLLAGLSTGIGSWITFFSKHTNRAFLSFSLGLAAGVLLFVSFLELLPESADVFARISDKSHGFMFAVLSFMGGLLLMSIIDFFAPHHENVHAITSEEIESLKTLANLKRIGVLISVAVVLHNIPEGVAMFTVGVSDYRLALPILAAIIIHNIPIGISISAPIYQATGSKSKALKLSLLTGLAAPFGALMAWLFLLPYWTPVFEGIVLGAVGGTMVYIALDELIPAAGHYGKHGLVKAGLLAGMVIMLAVFICFG
jgi:ZIP family zinc transporter